MKEYRDHRRAGLIKPLCAILALALLLGGCGVAAPSAAEPTPEPTVEPTPAPAPAPTPEPTPDPTPEPTPEPTPFVRTTYTVPDEAYIRQEIEKLGVINDTRKYPAYKFAYVLFEKDGAQRAVCVTMPNLEGARGDIIVKDAFTDMELFSFSVNDPGFDDDPGGSSVYAENLESITALNPYFENVKVIKISIFWTYWYYDLTRQYVPEENKYDFFNELTGRDPGDNSVTYDTAKARHTRQEVAYFYVKYLPEEYRVNAADLFGG